MPSFWEALRYWWWLGCVGFGGPAGQVARMREDLVDRRRWFSASEFDGALSFCTLLPGPEAQQLATYLGWRLHGIRGGLAAGLLFFLPGSALLAGLTALILAGSDSRAVLGALAGLQSAVVALVGLAWFRMALRLPVHGRLLGLLWFAPLVVFRTAWIFPLVLAVAGTWGVLRPGETPPETPTAAARISSPGASVRTALVALVAWWTPVVVVGLLLGRESTPWRLGVFFSQAALLTFGGAYAVLPFVGRHVVESAGWISPGALLDAFALGETTPGPLVLVLQHIGAVAGWNHPGTLPRPAAAALGGAVATWTTFAPSFLWIFTLGPHLARILAQPRWKGALAGLTPVVVAQLGIFVGQLAVGVAVPSGRAEVFPGAVAGLSLVALATGRLPTWAVVLAAAGAGGIRAT